MTPRGFLDDYRDTWTAILQDRSGIEALTPFFDMPCTMVLADETTRRVRTEAELLAFNTDRVTSFKAGGAAIAEFISISINRAEEDTAFAAVNWALRRADGSTERRWHHSYTLQKPGDSWRIALSTFRHGA